MSRSLLMRGIRADSTESRNEHSAAAYQPMMSHGASRRPHMRHATLFTLAALLAMNLAKADAIRFEHIPSDVEGFAFIDIDKLLSSNFVRQTSVGLGLSADFAAEQMKQAIGAQLNSVTIYASGGTEKTTVLVRAHD